jgi:hypothetical protein
MTKLRFTELRKSVRKGPNDGLLDLILLCFWTSCIPKKTGPVTEITSF